MCVCMYHLLSGHFKNECGPPHDWHTHTHTHTHARVQVMRAKTLTRSYTNTHTQTHTQVPPPIRALQEGMETPARQATLFLLFCTILTSFEHNSNTILMCVCTTADQVTSRTSKDPRTTGNSLSPFYTHTHTHHYPRTIIETHINGHVSHGVYVPPSIRALQERVWTPARLATLLYTHTHKDTHVHTRACNGEHSYTLIHKYIQTHKHKHMYVPSPIGALQERVWASARLATLFLLFNTLVTC
jgi:hypothetical protein